MKTLAVLLSMVPLCVSQVYAETVLVIGDSIARQLAPALQARIPEDVIVNAGVNGDTSRNLDRFIGALEAVGPVDRVVIQYGTNDDALGHLTPAASFRNLRAMTRLARRTGARVYVLTPPPLVCKHGPDFCQPGEPAYDQLTHGHEHTRVLGDHLKAARLGHPVTVLDLRDRWHTVPGGWWAHSDFFGTHPGPGGLLLMAGWVADAIEADRRER